MTPLAIANWTKDLPQDGFSVSTWNNPPAALFLCNNLKIADAICRKIRSEECHHSVDIWVICEGNLLHYDRIAKTFKHHQTPMQLTKDSSVIDAIAYAQTADTAVEITAMADNSTLFCNAVNIGNTEGVLWTPEDLKGFNASFYWKGFETDFQALMQALMQDGQALNFRFRNRRLDGNGFNWFTKDYFMVDVPLVGAARVAVTREWEHIPSMAIA